MSANILVEAAEQAAKDGRWHDVQRICGMILEQEPDNPQAGMLLRLVPANPTPPPAPATAPVSYAPPPSSGPRKKRSGVAAWTLITLLFLACGGIFLYYVADRSFSKKPTSSFGSSSNTTKSSYKVTYKITGNADSVSITYRNAQGGTEQQDVKSPWSKALTIPYGAFLYISGQNQGKYGKVTCSIEVDGVEVRTSSSGAAYGIATCNGNLK